MERIYCKVKTKGLADRGGGESESENRLEAAMWIFMSKSSSVRPESKGSSSPELEPRQAWDALGHLDSFASAAITKAQRLDGLNNRHFFP